MERSEHTIKTNNQRGLIQAVGGLLLTGTGLSMAIDAGFVRMKGGKWFGYGTAALVVFQTGLCLVVGSTRNSSKTH